MRTQIYLQILFRNKMFFDLLEVYFMIKKLSKNVIAFRIEEFDIKKDYYLQSDKYQ